MIIIRETKGRRVRAEWQTLNEQMDLEFGLIKGRPSVSVYKGDNQLAVIDHSGEIQFANGVSAEDQQFINRGKVGLLKLGKESGLIDGKFVAPIDAELDDRKSVRQDPSASTLKGATRFNKNPD